MRPLYFRFGWSGFATLWCLSFVSIRLRRHVGVALAINRDMFGIGAGNFDRAKERLAQRVGN